MRRAFSLIELMVTIGVIGVLIALAAPALRGTRESAMMTKSLVNTRTHHATIEQWGASRSGQFPFPADQQTHYPQGDGSAHIFLRNWQLPWHWSGVVDEVLPWREGRDAYLSPKARREDIVNGEFTSTNGGFPPSYEYSQSFVARPQVWMGRVPPSGMPGSWISPVYQHDVRFPSQKVLLWDWELPFIARELKKIGPELGEKTPTVFADGHAALHAPADAAEPAEPADPTTGRAGRRLHNTPEGVYGRDF